MNEKLKIEDIIIINQISHIKLIVQWSHCQVRAIIN